MKKNPFGKTGFDVSALGFGAAPAAYLKADTDRAVRVINTLLDQGLNLLDTADEMAQKVRKARTDPEPLPDNLEDLKARAEADNLVGIYGALSGQTKEQVLAEFAGQGFGAFKPKLADLAVAVLGPIGERMRGFMADPAEIDRILAQGAERAAEIAEVTVRETKEIVGFWRPGKA